MTNRNKHIPKSGDRVAVRGEKGTIVIYSVDSSLQAAEVKLIDRDLALSSMPWDALTFLDAEDASQLDRERSYRAKK